MSNNDKDDKLAESNDELNAVSFANLDLPLPDDNEINLPNWQEGDLGSSISAYTLYGLSQLDFKTNTKKKLFQLHYWEKMSLVRQQLGQVKH